MIMDGPSKDDKQWIAKGSFIIGSPRMPLVGSVLVHARRHQDEITRKGRSIYNGGRFGMDARNNKHLC